MRLDRPGAAILTRFRRALGAAFAALMLATNLAGAANGETPMYPGVNHTDVAPHRSAFVTVNGVKLNYLDWGDHGPPLVLIHGIGDDPHIFDDLAMLLHDRFHIIAYARRGHGLSGAIAPYDGDTLTEDLRQLLDALGVQRASFIGWSMGGDEITAFAGRYPARVDRLVYLDGGYDWSTPAFFKAFEATLAANSPGADDVRSIDTVRAWYHRAWLGEATAWTPGLEAYLRDVAQPDAEGRLHVKPDDAAASAVLATLGAWPRDYTKVQAPALALKLRDFNETTMIPFRRASIDRIRRELRGVRVEQFADRTHMSIGIEDPKSLADVIRTFLTGSPAR